MRLLEVPAGGPRQAAWADRYEAAHRDVFDVYYDGRGDPSLRSEAADTVEALVGGIQEREGRAAGLVRSTAAAMHERGLLDRPWLPTVLMVGGGTANGWVAPYAGEPALFLALENFPPSPYDAVLVAHEAAHVAHARASGITWPASVGEMAFIEGLAVAVSRELCPGLTASAYFWFDGDHDAWVQDCERRAGAIEAVAVAALETRDPAVLGRLFEGAAQPVSVPSRAGYWFGDRAVRRALESRSLTDLFRLDCLPV
ncbi:DUF2268 domain-containing putative Zn-dependent protease [Aquipuribacter hungaricus]|uniref:DUF2268 domain-containing putative Zn-dependent protease n=1 Tax=Aquipuribacter hungaricus TaxID=545624 RepID=UPI0030EEFD7A